MDVLSKKIEEVNDDYGLGVFFKTIFIDEYGRKCRVDILHDISGKNEGYAHLAVWDPEEKYWNYDYFQDSVKDDLSLRETFDELEFYMNLN